jgi:hypothetical protein
MGKDKEKDEISNYKGTSLNQTTKIENKTSRG